MTKLYQNAHYESDSSDLRVFIIKIQYRHPLYVKVKATLTNKRIVGVYYETKNYKIIRSNIKHWKIITDP